MELKLELLGRALAFLKKFRFYIEASVNVSFEAESALGAIRSNWLCREIDSGWASR